MSEDKKVNNVFIANGLNIPFLKIASFLVDNENEVRENNKAKVELIIKVESDNGVLTQGEDNIQVSISQLEYNQFKEKYYNWVNQMDEKLSNKSFYGGEKKHFEEVIGHIGDQLLSTFEDRLEKALKLQKSENEKRMEELLKTTEEIKNSFESNYDIIQAHQKNADELISKARKMYETLQYFLADTDDIKDHNKRLEEENLIKREMEK